MEKIERTIGSIFTVLYHAVFPEPIAAALVITVFTAVIKLILLKNRNENTNWLKALLLAVIKVFFSCLYLLTLIQITVINRISINRIDGFSNIWGGWFIIENRFSYDYSSVGNIFLFIPVVFVILSILGKNIKSSRKLIAATVVSSFGISLLIEITQALFSLGTFQFSDLFYNTLGGFLGVLLFLIIRKASRKR